MLVVEIVLAAVVVFGVAVVAMGYGGSITHFAPDWPGRALPEGRTLRAADVVGARFSLALRGYRMSEVDAALDRLAAEIADRDARIEQLTGRPYESLATSDAAPPVPSDAAPDAAAASDAAAADYTAPLYEQHDLQAFSDNPYAPPRDPDAGQ